MNESSHVFGSNKPALIEKTIGQVLQETAARIPEMEAIVSVEQGIRLTYAQFSARVERMAAGLLAMGLEKGDRVGIWAPNCVEWALTQFATARAGLIQVNINPAYRLSELEYALNKVGVRVLIAVERFKTSEYADMVETLAPEIADCEGRLSSKRLPTLEAVIQIGGKTRKGWVGFDDIWGEADAKKFKKLLVAPALSIDDPINIQFTSGTTGNPKGATLSHRNILNNGYFVGRAMGMTEGDRICVPVPLYHCFGMVMANLACIVHGATMIYPSAGFDAGAVLATIEAEKCTALYGVPTMFIAELAHPDFDRFDLTSLRAGIMAGSPCPIEVMRSTVSQMHMGEVTIAYGMTETSPVSFQSDISDPLERRVTTVGRIQPHLEAKVIEPDSGRLLARGEVGELCVRGYSVMLGYWDEEERTAEAIDEQGWMHSGDLGVIDEEGYCNIVGRAKDMIIRGGENVYPREIEEYLFGHPAIEDVTIVGIPDPKYGEEVCAWVKLRPHVKLEEEDLRAYCRGQIAHYKIPRYVRFVSEFPATVTGKVQKFVIREAMLKELGLGEEQTA
ncbi:AMP-binding protein [Parasphingorhabdus sp.]|uniref:AMP-binding protein n=1 Tax=Parasphingorhabdus sp. TaxID=2709688 RepID=UPI002B26D8B9|nr:AMP-binding protein [Parasphingorhabdus sp.]